MSLPSLNFNYILNFLLRLALEEVICKRSLKIKTSAFFRLGNRAQNLSLRWWTLVQRLEYVEGRHPASMKAVKMNESFIFQVQTIDGCTRLPFFDRDFTLWS